MSKHKLRKLNKLHRLNNRIFTKKEEYELNRLISNSLKTPNFWDMTGEPGQLIPPEELIIV